MKKILKYTLPLLLATSCATTNSIKNDAVTITFLDEYVIPKDLKVDNTLVGGLSGIDYKNNQFYFIVDTQKDARYYIADITLKNNKIDTVSIKKTVFIDKENPFIKKHTLDPEAIRYIKSTNEVVITSEGSIKNGKDPSIFTLDSLGNFKNNYAIPQYFSATGKQHPRQNGVFEGLAESYNQKGIWVAMELPLQKDGAKPKLYPTKSYTRITHYNQQTKQPTKQFAYKLDGISKIPWLYFAVNGVTELLEYKKDHFLVLERAFSAGHGSYSNTVKIFEVDASKASNTLDLEKLRGTKFSPAIKKLVFDFKDIKEQLTDEIIDNIEGMCFGPVLPNGKQSLLLISDNNFNSFANQLTQVILMEIDIK